MLSQRRHHKHLHAGHATLHPQIAAYIDVAQTEDAPEGYWYEDRSKVMTVHLVGWAFHLAALVRPVRFNADGLVGKFTLDPAPREDLVAAYGGDSALRMCGWDHHLSVPRRSCNLTGALEMQTPGGVWTPFLRVDIAPPLSGEKGENKTEEEAGEEESESGEAGKAAEEADKTEADKTEADKTEAENSNNVLLGTLRGDIGLGRHDLLLPSVVVVDDVYADPLAVRAFALAQPFRAHPAYHKGERTDSVYLFPGIKELIERRLGGGARINAREWSSMGTNGCFQWCKAGDTLVYHADAQQWAGVLFLTPDAPVQCGTTLFRSRATQQRRGDAADSAAVFAGGFLDATRFEPVDTIGNVFNRLVLFDARLIHAASAYFGTTASNGRLFQMFFFNLE